MWAQDPGSSVKYLSMKISDEHLVWYKQLVARVLYPSIILHTWPILVGFPIKTKIWFILTTTYYQQSLATERHLSKEQITNTVCGQFWLAIKVWPI